MNSPLRVLHLEDNPDYSSLVEAKLAAEGFAPEMLCVETRERFAQALEQEKFDLIIADYSLPTYDGIRAVTLAQEKAPGTPILLVSGTIGEQAAIDSLKAGATDYVLKHWPERLVPAVRRALREAEERRNRLQAETTLTRRENLFRALSENALDIVTILDREGRFIYNSVSIARMLGYQPDELHGQSAFDYAHPEDLAAMRETFRRVVAEPGLTVRYEFRFRHQDGTWRHLESVARNLLNDAEIAGVVVNTRDISERKETEAALRGSEIRFQSVWENSVDGMRLTDENGMVVAVNEAFCRVTGRSRPELEGQPFTVAQTETEAPDASLAAYRKGFRERSLERLVERRITPRPGVKLDVEVARSFVELRGQQPLLLELFRDITQQKRLEEQLRQSQKMEAIGQLAGGVAHDFNNILTVIQGHASLLRSAGGLQGFAASSAEQIAQASERAAALTRQLLTFSRRQMMQPRQLDLPVVVSNMTRMLGRILREDITLQFDYAPKVPPVRADAGMLEQVLLNLTVNSRDAMPLGGRLTIGIATVDLGPDELAPHPDGRVGQFVRLTVADTGCGIAPENLPHIFEPFFTTKEVGRGTGLGLATVYGIIKQHQGWTELTSEVNVGTTFHVFLPASDEPAEAQAETGQLKPVRGGTETILVVEDEAPVRELVCQILKTYGYRVLEATNGVTALTVWRENRDEVDLLLTDIVMPDGMTGRDLAATIQGEKPDLKAIYTSGYSADIVGKDFIIQAGVNFLQKPYQPEKLAGAVRKCLDGN